MYQITWLNSIEIIHKQYEDRRKIIIVLNCRELLDVSKSSLNLYSIENACFLFERAI
jgi:hypothetical protein